MKVALCLHGMVGSIKGKNFQQLGGGDKVLELSYKHNKHILEKYDTDVFVHSWSTEHTDDILNYYKPKNHLIEKQIQFEVPKFIKSSYDRGFAHLSRWYSFKENIRLVQEYSKLHGITYDLVLIQRFDLTWNIIPQLETLDPNTFYVGNCGLNHSREWSDRWFISSLANMTRFATMYDAIYEYMKPGGEFTSDKQYAGISSHYLCKYHAKKLGLQESFIYNFGEDKRSPNDYSEVRRQYYAG